MPRRKLVIAGCAAVLLVISVVAIQAVARNGTPAEEPANKNPETWTNKEMAKFLRDKKVDCYVVPGGDNFTYYCLTGGHDSKLNSDEAHNEWQFNRNVVRVEACGSEKAAKQRASQSEDWAYYGQYVFRGKGKFADSIKKAIGSN